MVISFFKKKYRRTIKGSLLSNRFDKCYPEFIMDRHLPTTMSRAGLPLHSINLMLSIDYYKSCFMQVCGNREAVEKLNVWLQNWKRRSVSLEKDTTHKKLSNESDYSEDHGCFEDDSDSGSDAAGDGTLPNVMFLAGPVGVWFYELMGHYTPL